MVSYPKELTCFVCDRQLDAIDPRNERDGRYTPYNGTIFTTQGHYGSTIFDEMDSSFLALTICDVCLMKKISGISLGKTITTSQTEYKDFELSERGKDWIEKASQNFNLTTELPAKTLTDGTTVSFVRRIDSENIIIAVDGIERSISLSETFTTRSNLEYSANYISEGTSEENHLILLADFQMVNSPHS